MATRKQATATTEESPAIDAAEAGVQTEAEVQQVNECPYGAGEEPKQEIPVNVDKLLKLFPNYKKLHVDDKGSVYTEGTKFPAGKKIPLYTNPYFKL